MPPDPEWIPETALLMAGTILVLVSLHLLWTGHRGRGLRRLGLGVGLILLGTFLGTSSWTHESNRATAPDDQPFPPLLPRSSLHASDPEEDDTTSTSLLLGAVLLRVAASDRYVLAFERRPFLVLDRRGRGLVVSCEVADSLDRVLARIRVNTIQYRAGAIQRPDLHTIRARGGGADSTDLFRLFYADPRRIEVYGRFRPEGLDTAVVLTRGIHWPGGGAPPGAELDLRHFGKGTIELERSGLIRIRR